MAHLYQALYLWVQTYGLPGAFLFMVGEGAGVPLPTELGFITAQGAITAHTVAYWQAFAWIASGQLIGSAVSFHFGRATDSAVARYLAHKQSVMAARERLQWLYARFGPLAILFGRLVGQVRPWASFIAGMSQVPAFTFWLWTVVGTAIFTAVAMWLTAVGWKFWLAHASLRLPLIICMLLIFYGLPAYKIIEHLIKRYRQRRLHRSSE